MGNSQCKPPDISQEKKTSEQNNSLEDWKIREQLELKERRLKSQTHHPFDSDDCSDSNSDSDCDSTDSGFGPCDDSLLNTALAKSTIGNDESKESGGDSDSDSGWDEIKYNEYENDSGNESGSNSFTVHCNLEKKNEIDSYMINSYISEAKDNYENNDEIYEVDTDKLNQWRDRMRQNFTIIKARYLKCIKCGAIDYSIMGGPDLFGCEWDTIKREKFMLTKYEDVFREHVYSTQVDEICQQCTKQINETQWHNTLNVLSKVDVLDLNSKWCEAIVVSKNTKNKLLFIHYIGWSAKYREWIEIGSPRIKKQYSVVENWRININVGYSLEVKHNNKWYLGVVTSLGGQKNGYNNMLFSVTIFLKFQTSLDNSSHNKETYTEGTNDYIISCINIYSSDICKKGTHISAEKYANKWNYVDRIGAALIKKK